MKEYYIQFIDGSTLPIQKEIAEILTSKISSGLTLPNWQTFTDSVSGKIVLGVNLYHVLYIKKIDNV